MLKSNYLSKIKRVALDSNIFIYALEDSPDFPEAINLLRDLARSSCQIVTSAITLTEVTVPIYRLGRNELILKYTRFVEGEGRIKVRNVSKSVALKAAELRAKFKFKTPDAIQLATAILSEAELFITADRHYSQEHIGKVKIIVLEPQV